MDIRAYFGHGASQIESSSSDEHECDETDIHESGPPMKKFCADTVHHHSKSRPVSSSREYNKKWENNFPWLEDCQGAFCKVCKKEESHLKGLEVLGLSSLSITGVRQLKKYAQSNFHEAEQATRSIIQQIQSTTEEERMKNTLAIKLLIHCTHSSLYMST